MKLSQIMDRLLRALEENSPNAVYLGGVRVILNGLMQQYGDVELNIEVRRVPMEVVYDGEAKERPVEPTGSDADGTGPADGEGP